MKCGACARSKVTIANAQASVNHAARKLVRQETPYNRDQLVKAQNQLRTAKESREWHLQQEH